MLFQVWSIIEKRNTFTISPADDMTTTAQKCSVKTHVLMAYLTILKMTKGYPVTRSSKLCCSYHNCMFRQCLFGIKQKAESLSIFPAKNKVWGATTNILFRCTATQLQPLPFNTIRCFTDLYNTKYVLRFHNMP